MTGRGTLLGIAGVGLGAGVAGVVAALLHRTLQPVEEIRRYADDIAQAATGIVTNLSGAEQLSRTRELAIALSGLVATSPPTTAGESS